MTVEDAPRAPVVLSVNVGLPKDVMWHGKAVHTGIWKYPVVGPTMVRRLNIDGDGQGDLEGHGGEQRAVLVYQIESYRYWQRHFERTDFEFGQFGENFTIDGLADSEVCVGDRYRIGEAEFEVTQPRVTCYRVGLRLGEPELPSLLVGHHRPGFYMRVIQEGHVQAGDQIIKTTSGPGALSVADIDALLYLPDRDPATLRLALAVPALSPGWQQSFRDLLARADGTASAADASIEPAWNGFRSLRVAKVIAETATVSSIYLDDPEGARLPPALAGQYLTVRLAGAGTPAPVRSYSLSSGPGDDTYRISVKREPHGVVSTYLHRMLQLGADVDVAAPRGTFVLEDAVTPVVLVSAGIGVTPVLSMLHRLAALHSEREVWWIHGARGPHEHPLAAEAHDLLASLPHANEHLFYSAATAQDDLPGHVTLSRLNGDQISRLGVPTDADVYLCGPSAFMTDLTAALTANGIAPSRIHTELFAALASINPGMADQTRPAPHQPTGRRGQGPLVTFARSGISTPFDSELGSVLELAEACDVSTRWSCRTGVCHTCVTPLLTGTISYEPLPLELPANDNVLICCAKPDTDIVLDM